MGGPDPLPSRRGMFGFAGDAPFLSSGGRGTATSSRTAFLEGPCRSPSRADGNQSLSSARDYVSGDQHGPGRSQVRTLPQSVNTGKRRPSGRDLRPVRDGRRVCDSYALAGNQGQPRQVSPRTRRRLSDNRAHGTTRRYSLIARQRVPTGTWREAPSCPSAPCSVSRGCVLANRAGNACVCWRTSHHSRTVRAHLPASRSKPEMLRGHVRCVAQRATHESTFSDGCLETVRRLY